MTTFVIGVSLMATVFIVKVLKVNLLVLVGLGLFGWLVVSWWS